MKSPIGASIVYKSTEFKIRMSIESVPLVIFTLKPEPVLVHCAGSITRTLRTLTILDSSSSFNCVTTFGAFKAIPVANTLNESTATSFNPL